MFYDQPSLLTHDDLSRELAVARRQVTQLVNDIRSFTVLAHDQPWLHLDDLLRELRAAVVTVSTLEQLQGAGS